MPEKKESKKRGRENLCVCLEVGSREDIVTDMNVESIPMVETNDSLPNITLFILLLTFFFF